jgi:hypothetical protein
VVMLCFIIGELDCVNSFFCSDWANRIIGNINIVIKKSRIAVFIVLELTAIN